MSGPTLNSATVSGNNFVTLVSWTLNVTSVATNDTIVIGILNTTNANPTLLPTSVVDGQGSYTLQGYSQNAFNNTLALYTLTNAVSGTHAVTITFPSAVSGGVLWSTWSNAGGSYVDGIGGSYTSATTTLSTTLSSVASSGTVISVANSGGVAPTGSGFSAASWFTGGGLGSGVTGQYFTQTGNGLVTPSYTYASSTYGEFVSLILQNTGAPSNNSGFFLLPQFRI